MLNMISRVISSRAAVVFVITTLWLIAFCALLFHSGIRNDLHAFLVRYPNLAPLLLIVCQVVLASFVLPCSPLTVLAGILWGFDVAIVYSVIATITGSLWTFILSRWVFKKWVSLQMAPKIFQEISELITRYTWRASAIAHANPAFPGSSLGYAFGITDVSLISYAGGAVLGVLPLQVMLVGLGHVLSQTLATSMIQLALMLSSLLFLFMMYRRWVPRICGVDSDLSLNHK